MSPINPRLSDKLAETVRINGRASVSSNWNETSSQRSPTHPDLSPSGVGAGLAQRTRRRCTAKACSRTMSRQSSQTLG